jgi:hypothetical protein
VDIFLPSLEESLLILEPESFQSYQAMGPKEKDQATPDLAFRMAKGFLELGASVVGIKCGILGYHVQTSPDLTRERLGKGTPKNLPNWTNRRLWCASYKPETFTSATWGWGLLYRWFVDGTSSRMKPRADGKLGLCPWTKYGPMIPKVRYG